MSQPVKKSRSIALKIIVAVVLFVAALCLFSFLAHEAVFEHEDMFDSRAFHFFKSHVPESMLGVVRALTFFGSHYFLFPAYLFLVIIYLVKNRRQDAIDIAIIGVTSTAMMFILKGFFHRERPDMPLVAAVHGYSFPSGHSLSSFIFCSVLIHYIWKGHWTRFVKISLSALLLIFAISIGISRIILRVHYPTDVLAGFCFGYSWVTLLFLLQRKLRASEKKVERAQVAAPG